MKRSDWAGIILIAGLVGLASFFTVSKVMPQPEDNLQKVPVVPKFTSSVTDPPQEVFNKDALNPTVRITIGNQSNQRPFNVGSN